MKTKKIMRGPEPETSAPLTVEQLIAEVRRMDPHVTARALQAGVVMLAALQEGTQPDRLTAFTAYPKKTVREFVTRLRMNGVFTGDGHVAANWFDPEEGGAAFWCDVAVCLGFIQRTESDDSVRRPRQHG